MPVQSQKNYRLSARQADKRQMLNAAQMMRRGPSAPPGSRKEPFLSPVDDMNSRAENKKEIPFNSTRNESGTLAGVGTQLLIASRSVG